MPSCVVGISDFWERLVVYIEEGSALLHYVGFVVLFCMSSCTGVAGLGVSQQWILDFVILLFLSYPARTVMAGGDDGQAGCRLHSTIHHAFGRR